MLAMTGLDIHTGACHEKRTCITYTAGLHGEEAEGGLRHDTTHVLLLLRGHPPRPDTIVYMFLNVHSCAFIYMCVCVCVRPPEGLKVAVQPGVQVPHP